MNPVETQATVAVLAAYLEGRKDGLATGIALSAGLVLFWKAYKRGRDSTGAFRVFGTNKR